MLLSALYQSNLILLVTTFYVGYKPSVDELISYETIFLNKNVYSLVIKADFLRKCGKKGSVKPMYKAITFINWM